MLKADDCRKKAALALLEAEAVRSPEARAALQRLAEQWTALASQIEREVSAYSLPRRAIDARDKPPSADVADVLRSRLRLTEGGEEDDPTDPSSTG